MSRILANLELPYLLMDTAPMSSKKNTSRLWILGLTLLSFTLVSMIQTLETGLTIEMSLSLTTVI